MVHIVILGNWQLEIGRSNNHFRGLQMKLQTPTTSIPYALHSRIQRRKTNDRDTGNQIFKDKTKRHGFINEKNITKKK